MYQFHGGSWSVNSRAAYGGPVSDDTWAPLADRFADGAYATVKGYVRTHVLHHQLLEHLPAAPAGVLDVGGGAGHQSFPLAVAGYDVTVLDSSPAMLDKACERLERLPGDARARVTLVEADGFRADEAVGGSTPCCVTGCSGTSTSPSRWSSSCAGAPPRVGSSRS